MAVVAPDAVFLRVAGRLWSGVGDCRGQGFGAKSGAQPQGQGTSPAGKGEGARALPSTGG